MKFWFCGEWLARRKKFGKIDLIALSAVAKHLRKNRITQMQKKQLEKMSEFQFNFVLNDPTRSAGDILF